MKYVISADIGTQGTKTAVVGEDGRIVASAFRPSNLIRGEGGVVEQDPEEMFRSVTDGIREALEASGVPPESVAAIGLDGQMAGILGIGRDGNAVTHYDSWLDVRCEKYIPAMKAWGEEELIRITGCPVSYAHGPKKLWWKHERPETYRDIAKFVVPSAYVAGRLAGLGADQAFIDYTHLHFSGFADVERMKWSQTLLDAFGIDREKMPNIVKPWDVVGELTKRWADETGLPAGVRIVAGCGDTAAATFGAGLVRPGQWLDIAGTASVLTCVVDRYRPDAETKTLLYARSVVPGLWAPLAYISGGGECLAWFRKLVSPDAGPGHSFDELNALAESAPPGSDGLLFVPHFGGRTCPNNTDLRGSWIGLNWSHGKAAMYRAIQESIAYEYKMYLGTLEKLVGGIDYEQGTVVGGGASGHVFNQIKCDVLGLPLRTMSRQDSALVANAVVAGYGVGLFPDLAGTVTSFVSFGAAYRPDPDRHAKYEAYARTYRKAVDALIDLYGSLK
ncbi:xylulokinase [Paenibacillus sp.]|uniref:xylulokinase n=1 Tax=Paenibacillus sp. TaxID=58172 RepID=UPI002D69A467|nr:FGGY family carbohydrate kinase [Paenibacillus sp.]HZG86607.1 FGGY family carbohydrate kinase [Paenibacillus sp.]